MYAHKSTLVRIGEAHQQFQGIWRYGSSYTKQLAASWLRCGSSSLYATRRTVRLSSVAECAAVSNSEDQVLTSKPKPTRKALKGSLRSRGNTYGIFLCSGSPAAAEAISFSGVDWVCIDTQHGAVGYAELANLIRAVALGGAKSIVRVGGPDDRYGIQQALDLGAAGVMVPVIDTPQQAQLATSYCLYPPQGIRSAVYPSPAAVRSAQIVGPGALSQYLQDANREVEVWLQVESVACLGSIEALLAVPGVTCAFLGPADMALSLGLHESYAYDLGAAMSSPEMKQAEAQLLAACAKHGIPAGTFCFGVQKSKEQAHQGFKHIGFDVDTNMLMASASVSLKELRAS